MEADNLFTGIVAEVNKFIGEFQGEMPKVIGKDKFMEQPQSDYAKRKEYNAYGRTEAVGDMAEGRNPQDIIDYFIQHEKGRQ